MVKKYMIVGFFLGLFNEIAFAHSANSSEEIFNHTNINLEPIDVVIPSTSWYLPTLNLCIQNIRKYGKNVRRIIVVSANKLTDEAEWFDEKQFKFSPFDVAFEIFQNKEQALSYIQTRGTRIGWLYQQFLKLYAPLTIPNISSNVLVLDSDIIFIRPVSFFDDKGRALYNIGPDYHKPYFEHMKKLLPHLHRNYESYSGITHHMIFQRHIIEELCQKVQQLHKVELWQAMCRCIDHKHLFHSAFSEYEIYFNFIFDHPNSDKVKIRFLKWIDTCKIDDIKKLQDEGYDYISCQSFLR